MHPAPKPAAKRALSTRPVDSKAQPVTISLEMELDDRARPSGDFVSQLAAESLDRYSQGELDERIAILEGEIARIVAHRDRVSTQRLAAEALFKRPENGGPVQ